jgi:hypothetical protein
VLLAFPLILMLLGAVLVGLSVNGSSSGALRPYITSSADPDLLAGTPEKVRSDEWNVQTVWAIAQAQQGFPVTNESFPGGMDATVSQDLPRADWSVAFRPHLLGFLFLDLGRATAWKWWFPGLALIAAAYCFVVTVLPRRPLVAAALAVGFYFSPLFQWWFLPTTLWPVVWGLTTMTAILWSLKSISRAGRWVWASIVGYLTVVMAMGIYVPYIIPVVIVVAFFAIGCLVAELRSGTGLRQTVSRVIPIIATGIAGSAITGWWLYTRLPTVEAFLGTTYPGVRLTSTGTGGVVAFIASVSSSFTQALQSGGLLGENSSEASTFFFVGAFLIPACAWIALRQRRLRGAQPWPLLALIASIVVFALFLYLPGWNAIAHLLFLDRTTENRLRIGIGLASFAMVPQIIRYLDTARIKVGVRFAAAGAAIFLVSQVAIAVALSSGAKHSFAAANLWWVFALLGTACLWFYARSRPGLATAAFLILTVAGSATVNPVYRGVYDVRTTAVAKAVMALDSARPTTWVGIGDKLATDVLVESGARSYNGFQGAPSTVMWKQIDPANAYTFQWNRMGGVNWVAGTGVPVVSNPFADQIVVTFDACAAFAQHHVDAVLADGKPLASPCLVPQKSFAVTAGKITIYRVVP